MTITNGKHCILLFLLYLFIISSANNSIFSDHRLLSISYNRHSIRDGHLSEKVLSHYSSDFIDLLRAMIHSNPFLRPSCDDILNISKRYIDGNLLGLVDEGVNGARSNNALLNELRALREENSALKTQLSNR
jgi:hypothetical protein